MGLLKHLMIFGKPGPRHASTYDPLKHLAADFLRFLAQIAQSSIFPFKPVREFCGVLVFAPPLLVVPRGLTARPSLHDGDRKSLCRVCCVTLSMCSNRCFAVGLGHIKHTVMPEADAQIRRVFNAITVSDGVGKIFVINWN